MWDKLICSTKIRGQDIRIVKFIINNLRIKTFTNNSNVVAGFMYGYKNKFIMQILQKISDTFIFENTVYILFANEHYSFIFRVYTPN